MVESAVTMVLSADNKVLSADNKVLSADNKLSADAFYHFFFFLKTSHTHPDWDAWLKQIPEFALNKGCFDKICFRPGWNRRPSACEVDVIFYSAKATYNNVSRRNAKLQISEAN
jgi:hypothetical protein